LDSFSANFQTPNAAASILATVSTPRSPALIEMEIPSYMYVLVELLEDNKIALIKYNRPKSGNSLHPQLLKDVVSAVKWADQQPQISIIIQSGVGRFFSTGMELAETEDTDDGNGAMGFAKGSSFHELNTTLILSEKVLIAAVNGPAAGYGVSSLALFDLVYSVPDAYFFTPFVKWGMAAEGASSFSFPRLMGHQKAAALFLAGERISAGKAERLGLITEILPAKNFMEDVLQIAKRISESPPGSLKATKKLMRDPVRQNLLDANDRECEILQNERHGSQEARDAMKNFKTEQDKKRRLKSRM
jgi:peroxisomal 3,2-trans-enoyl-CoA isomerase